MKKGLKLLSIFCLLSSPALLVADDSHTLSLRSAVALYSEVETAVQMEAASCAEKLNSSQDSFSCERSKSYLEDKLRSSVDTNNFLQGIQGRKPKVIFLGESHIDDRVHSRQASLIEALADNDKELNCFFLESPSSHQTYIDDYLNGKKSFDNSVALLQHSSIYNPLAAARKDLLDMAKRKNIKVFAVDTASDNMDVRNQAMSEGISSRISNGTCAHGVMIVGKNHLRQDVVDSHPKSYPSIPKTLKSQNVSTFSVNLEQGSFDWMQNDCQKRIEAPKSEAAFFTSEPSPARGNRPYMEEVFRPTMWNDFDATLVIP